MTDLFFILISVVGTIFDQVFALLAACPEAGFIMAAIIVTPNFPPPITPEEQAGSLTKIRRWHGSKDERFDAVKQMVEVLNANVTRWMQPGDLRTFCLTIIPKLQEVFDICKSENASLASRKKRDALIKQSVNYSLGFVKLWAYGEFAAGSMTVDELHSLGFLVPGERAGSRRRVEVNKVMPETKARIYNEDHVMIVIDQAADKNAAEVHHGWPTGVKHALISIFEQNGKTEVYHQLTTKLHTLVKMPTDSHGKSYLVKSAFLKHVDDDPIFGVPVTFSMPATTQDLLIALDNQHEEEAEQHRRDVEAMEKELKKG